MCGIDLVVPIGTDQQEVPHVRLGRVSRASPVQTAARNCTRDEGRSLGIGIQVLVSNHRKLLRSKAVVVSVAGTSGRTPAGMVRRGERKQTVDDVS
jgi:hypothetical protein